MVVCCGCGWLCWDAVILSIAAVLITLVWLFVGRGQSGDLIAEVFNFFFSHPFQNHPPEPPQADIIILKCFYHSWTGYKY